MARIKSLSVPKVIYKGAPKPHSWVRYMIARTMKKNQNNLVVVVGKTGSGKTWSAISIAEMMAKLDGVPFTVDHIVFTLTDFMKLINSDKVRRGSKIIFDEPQVSINAREFQSKANKIFNYVATTFRHRNFTVFFCTPFEDLLDKATRRLFHAKFETVSINPNTQTCKIKPRYMEYSGLTQKTYYKRLLVFYRDERGIAKATKVDYWDVPKPSDEIIELYEKKKLEFTTMLNRNIMLSLELNRKKGEDLTADPRKPLTKNQLVTMVLLARGFKILEIAEILNSPKSNISFFKVSAERKGYKVEEFKDYLLDKETEIELREAIKSFKKDKETHGRLIEANTTT